MVRLFPQDGVTFGCQANYFWRQDLYEEADAAFINAVRLTPNYAWIRHEYGRFLASRGRYAEAEAEFHSAISVEPSFAETYFSLGKLFEETKRFEKAEMSYKKAIKLSPGDNRAYLELWKLLKNQNRLLDAERYFKSTASGKTGNPVSYRFIVLSLWQQKKLKEAEKYAQELVKLNPNDMSILLVHGHIFDDLNLDQDAERIYRQAIDKYPSAYEPYFNLGRILEKKNLLNEAQELYRKAYSIDPNGKEAFDYLIRLLRKNEQYQEALNLLHESLKHNSEDFASLVTIASINKIVGKEHEIGKYAEKARTLLTHDEYYNYNLACLEGILGNSAAALESLNNAKHENQLDQTWAWEDPDLQWIRGDPRFIEIVGPKPEKKNSEA